MTYQCDAKKAGEVEFRCYFQLAMMIIGGKWKPKAEYSLTDLGKSFIPVLNAMFNWGKSYASYLVAKEKENCEFQPGNVFENIEELVSKAKE